MRELWNDKFSRAGFLYGEEANNFVKENLKLFKKNSDVLCLGEGEGRNALFLAKQGLHVEALDASDVGLEKLKLRAKEEDVEIKTFHLLFEDWNSSMQHDAIVCTFMHLPKSLQQHMFEKTLEHIKENGHFIAEFFSIDQLNYKSGGPKNEDLLYSLDFVYQVLSNLPCEILKLSQEITHLSEGVGHNGDASVIRIILKKDSTFRK